MTSFGWKRKFGEKVKRDVSCTFQRDAKDEDIVEEIDSGEIDWLNLAPKRRNVQLEDSLSKSERLKHEGEVLAEAERYWEALKKWEEALHLTPESAVIYELKAQAYIALNELYPAITAAKKATEMNPLWWVAHQTLGRAHINLGEVRTAIKCFSKAVHLNPSDENLWTEDLKWAHSLLQSKLQLAAETQHAEEEAGKAQITELNEEESSERQSLVPLNGKRGNLDTDLLHLDSKSSSASDKASLLTSSKTKSLKDIPDNYVFMRD